MELFEDYYELLQVHHRAELSVIEAAYKKLAHKYHPDHNKSPHASDFMKKINVAHDILCNPAERKDYDVIWARNADNRHAKDEPATNNEPNPALVVLPKYIRFKDLGYGDIKTTYFDVKNTGGPYTHYSIARESLPPWLEITGIQTLTNNVLPVRVHIKAIGQFKGTQYDYYIPVRLENSRTGYRDEIKVRVEMVMKEPILQFDRKSMDFHIIPNTIPQPHIVTLHNTGMRRIEGNLSSRQSWIKISPRAINFAEKQDIQVQIDAAKLYTDVYGYIDVKTNCGDEVLTVRVQIDHETSGTKKKKGKSHNGALHECPECKEKAVRLDPHEHKYECLQCRSYWPASGLACS
jgi:hypothetical protein